MINNVTREKILVKKNTKYSEKILYESFLIIRKQLYNKDSLFPKKVIKIESQVSPHSVLIGVPLRYELAGSRDTRHSQPSVTHGETPGRAEYFVKQIFY